jgi:hypothetical protein
MWRDGSARGTLNKIFYTSSNSQLSDRNPLGEHGGMIGMVVGLIIKMMGSVLRLSCQLTE